MIKLVLFNQNQVLLLNLNDKVIKYLETTYRCKINKTYSKAIYCARESVDVLSDICRMLYFMEKVSKRAPNIEDKEEFITLFKLFNGDND